MSNLTLIQLVGDQTVQNLLPVMALRPNRIIQVRSQDSGDSTRFKDAANNFCSAVTQLQHEAASKGYKPDVTTDEIPSTSPGIESTRQKIANILASTPQRVVNFTGATKLMSIGAHKAAADLTVPSIYCDTQEKCFTDGGTGPLGHWPDFTTTASALTVPLLMAAHGKNPRGWRHDTPTAALKAFGLTAFEVRHTRWKELADFNRALRAHFYRNRGKVPDNVNGIIGDSLPSSCSASEPGVRLLESAVTAGLLRKRDSDFLVIARPGHPGASARERAKHKRREVERVANLLIGSWLEVALLAMLENHPRYQNPLWSVEPKRRDDTDFGEMDLVCVDQRTASLRYLSCKAVLDDPLEHLEAVGDRAHRVGGSHAAGTLVLFHPKDAEQELKINGYAKRLRIDAAIGAPQIMKEFSVPSPPANS